MWHTLEYIAENQRLEEKSFIDFAIANREKYKLDEHNMASTWNVDQLVKDFLTRSNDSKIYRFRSPKVVKIKKENELKKILSVKG